MIKVQLHKTPWIKIFKHNVGSGEITKSSQTIMAGKNNVEVLV